MSPKPPDSNAPDSNTPDSTGSDSTGSDSSLSSASSLDQASASPSLGESETLIEAMERKASAVESGGGASKGSEEPEAHPVDEEGGDSDSDEDSNEFNTRKVLLSAGEILLERPFAILGISAVLQAPQLLIPVLVEQGLMGSGPDPASVVEILTFYCLLFFLGQLQVAFLAPLALARLWGGSISVGESLRQTLERPFALITTALLWSFFAGLGLLLLIIPGFLAMTILYTTMPALLVERLSPVQALTRASELIRGRMFSLLALVVIFSIAERGADLLAGYLELPELVPALVALVINTLAALSAATAYHYLRLAPAPVFQGPEAVVDSATPGGGRSGPPPRRRGKVRVVFPGEGAGEAEGNGGSGADLQEHPNQEALEKE
ncbi:MAG: hypothetical protein AAGD01_04085 [Acidobacteriota bacterium]